MTSSAPGSSPRVRGRLRGTAAGVLGGGLIPASAGQTDGGTRTRTQPGAHPRECGADRPLYFSSTAIRGSSPRVRGRQQFHGSREVLARLIPASAGQTCHASKTRQAGGAHPRECGADAARESGVTWDQGSSPRVRGRRRYRNYGFHWHGLIPASAGQTAATIRDASAPSAHPRECGADPGVQSWGCMGVGSSPRVRGRPRYHHRCFHQSRLIPASAGQTP